jgi:hypothetical protein
MLWKFTARLRADGLRPSACASATRFTLAGTILCPIRILVIEVPPNRTIGHLDIGDMICVYFGINE